jgi:hypothetical protein
MWNEMARFAPRFQVLASDFGGRFLALTLLEVCVGYPPAKE